ncbi:MAG: glycoside hydrolase family 11 protein [Phycisphaerae bacterium]
MKKFLLVMALAALCVTVAHAGRTDISCSGTVTINYNNAAWIGGHGWSSGSGRTISWSASCSGCQFGPGVYGWGTNPLVEYYIGRGGGTSAGSYSTSKGTFTLYTNNCNGPNITGSGSFQQYNASGNGGSGQNMGEHSNGWSSRGKGTNMGGGYQIVAGENYGNATGTARFTVSGANWGTVWWGSGSASISCGSGGGSTTTSGGGGGGGSKTIVVRARGVSGQEQINLRIDNNTIATWTLGKSMANRSATTNSSGGINIQYFNDASGRDVQVDYIVVNGSTRQAEAQSYNTAVWQNNSCGGSNSEWMHCNGVIGFGNTP